MKPTIRDVAEKAGVSVATASRVLTGQGYSSAEAQEKVHRAVRELGYVANALAQGLVKGQANTIGVVIPDVINPFFPMLVKEIGAMLLQQHLLMVICNTDESIEAEAEFYQTLGRGQMVSGIIVARSEYPNDVEGNRVLHRLGLEVPLVILDRRIATADVVLTDDEDAGFQAARHLIDLGHQRIAMICGPDGFTFARDRRQGYHRAMREAHLTDDISEERVSRLDPYSGSQCALHLLDQSAPPTAIFAINDVVALGVLNAARGLGLTIPRDLSVIGIDDIFVSSLLQTELTTVRLPIAEVAKLAVSLLLRRIQAKQPVEVSAAQTLRGSLIVRGSTCEMAPR